MSDAISQYEDRRGDNEIGWGAAIALSAAFHVGAFVFFVWLLPALMAALLVLVGSVEAPEEEKEEAIMVRLLEDVPPPPEEISPKNFVREPLDSPPPPKENILDEVLPQEEKASPPPPAVAKTKAPPPKAIPPEVKKAETPRPKPAQASGDESGGPRPIAGLSESAASRLLGRSLGYEPGQVMAGAAGLRQDEELTRYLEAVRARIRSVWAPSGRAMAAQKPTRYELRIEADGRISRAGMTQSSGNRDFDQSVERALKKASPFPPLPSVFGGQPAILDLSLSPEQMR